MRCLLTALTAFAITLSAAFAADSLVVPLADGFDCPVGRDGTKQYYKSRGFRPNGHLGEDWNGQGGGDSDLGDPVYATANGVVVFAKDYRAGWGNVVIIRHAYQENGRTLLVDSLYGHLNEIKVREGQIVTRGKQIGTIGNNHGMYDAHLHFEMRKDIRVGMFRHKFPRTSETYWDPTEFIAARASLGGKGLTALVPLNTFPTTGTGGAADTAEPGSTRVAETKPLYPSRPGLQLRRTSEFKVDRFSDMRQ